MQNKLKPSLKQRQACVQWLDSYYAKLDANRSAALQAEVAQLSDDAAAKIVRAGCIAALAATGSLGQRDKAN